MLSFVVFIWIAMIIFVYIFRELYCIFLICHPVCKMLFFFVLVSFVMCLVINSTSPSTSIKCSEGWMKKCNPTPCLIITVTWLADKTCFTVWHDSEKLIEKKSTWLYKKANDLKGHMTSPEMLLWIINKVSDVYDVICDWF